MIINNNYYYWQFVSTSTTFVSDPWENGQQKVVTSIERHNLCLFSLLFNVSINKHVSWYQDSPQRFWCNTCGLPNLNSIMNTSFKVQNFVGLLWSFPHFYRDGVIAQAFTFRLMTFSQTTQNKINVILHIKNTLMPSTSQTRNDMYMHVFSSLCWSHERSSSLLRAINSCLLRNTSSCSRLHKRSFLYFQLTEVYVILRAHKMWQLSCRHRSAHTTPDKLPRRTIHWF